MTTDSATPRFLVTGGAGFIGGNFVAKILREEVGEILVLDLLTYAGHKATLSAWENHPNFRFVEGDIGDATLVEKLLKDFRPTYIVNFAAESHVDRSIEAAKDFIMTNIVGTFNLLERAVDYYASLTGDEAQRFKFHHVSTDEVYGSLGATGYFTEETPFAPNSPYAASKASSDHLVRAYHKTHKLPTTITNCSNNYGPYQFPEKLIPVALLKALAGEKIPVYGDGQNVRDWLFVEDHCTAILHVLAHGRHGETYNVGGDSERTNLELLDTLFECLKEHAALIGQETEYSTDIEYHSLIEFVKDRPGHDRRYAINASKLKQELGWIPSVNFKTGLSKTVAWYIRNLDWCKEVMSDNYDGSRLGTARTTKV